MDGQSTYTVVTVVYEGDTAGLELQARSLGIHASPDLISSVIVIGNFNQAPDTGWWEKTRLLYGPLADRAVLMPAKDVSTGIDGLTGWWSQQVLKIEIAKLISTDAYLILDSKHHLLKPLERSFLQDDLGRLRIRCANYQGHSLRGYLTNALTEFSLPESAADFFPTTTPPFPFDTKVALRLMQHGEAASGSLARYMLGNQLTEFFSYSAFLLATGELDHLYDLHSMPYPMVWPRKTDDDAVLSVIKTAREGESPFFAVHRRAAGDLSAHAKAQIASLWVDAGLRTSAEDAMVTLGLLALPKLTFWGKLTSRVRRIKPQRVAAQFRSAG